MNTVTQPSQTKCKEEITEQKNNLHQQLENTSKKTSMPARSRLGVGTKCRQAVELLHDFLQLVFSLLQVEVPSDYWVFSGKFDDFFAVEVVEQP